MRKLIVEALHRTANVFSNAAISDRLLDPNGIVGLDELGLDSLDRVEWSIEIEGDTGLTVDPGALSGLKTVGDFAHYLVELESKSTPAT